MKLDTVRFFLSFCCFAVDWRWSSNFPTSFRWRRQYNPPASGDGRCGWCGRAIEFKGRRRFLSFIGRESVHSDSLLVVRLRYRFRDGSYKPKHFSSWGRPWRGRRHSATLQEDIIKKKKTKYKSSILIYRRCTVKKSLGCCFRLVCCRLF